MRHRRCISAILMSFVLFLQPAYAVPSEENQPENSQENNTENEKRQQEQISAPSAILMEASTGQIIYEKNPDKSYDIVVNIRCTGQWADQAGG